MLSLVQSLDARRVSRVLALLRNRRSVCDGFTLVELLIAMGIVVTLAGLALPTIGAARERALVERAAHDIRVLHTELEQYAQVHREYPGALSEIGRGGVLDPWGNPYEYLNYDKSGGAVRKDHFLVPINSNYDLYSKGADGKSSAPLTATGSRDDVILANDGLFIGLAEDF